MTPARYGRPGYHPRQASSYTRFFGEFFDESRSSGTGKADQGLDQAEEGGADSRRLGSFTDACQGGWFDGLTTNGYGLTTNGCGNADYRKEVL